MSDRAAAELQDDVVAEQIEQLMHLPGVDAAGSNRHDLAQRAPVLLEVVAAQQVDLRVRVATDVVVALHGRRIAFELADRGAGMDVIDAGQAHPFGNHAEADAMILLARVRAVPGAMQVQDHVVVAAPVRQRLDAGVADDEIDHDDDRAQFLGERCAPVHFLHVAGRDVEITALDLAGRGGGFVDRIHDVQETIAPVHERLRVDVLVVLHEVEATLQSFVDDTAVVAAGQAELRLGRRAEQRPAEFVEALALDDDPGRRPAECFHVGDRKLHVLQARSLERLEAEDVADDRGPDVGDRTFLEQRQVVSDVGEILARIVRHRVDAVRLGPVHVAGGQAIGPDHGPRCGRGLAGDRGSRLDRVDTFLRRDAE